MYDEIETSYLMETPNSEFLQIFEKFKLKNLQTTFSLYQP